MPPHRKAPIVNCVPIAPKRKRPPKTSGTPVTAPSMPVTDPLDNGTERHDPNATYADQIVDGRVEIGPSVVHPHAPAAHAVVHPAPVVHPVPVVHPGPPPRRRQKKPRLYPGAVECAPTVPPDVSRYTDVEVALPGHANVTEIYSTQLQTLATRRAALVHSVNPVPVRHGLDAASLAVVSASQSTESILQMLSQSPRDTLRVRGMDSGMLGRAHVTIVTRAWEERFLHEASGAERACVNGASRSCFAGLIPSNGMTDASFSLVEFYTDDEYERIRRTSWNWPVERKACVLCRRNEALSRLLSCRCNGTCAPSSVCFSSIGNLVEKPKEYCVEDVFVSKPGCYEGILVPVVIPCVRDYAVTSVGGIRYLQQMLPYPEDRQSSFFF